MTDEQTICYKVTKCIEEIEKSLKTKVFNAPKVAKLLHEIRQDAQHMEDGLKLRKKIMATVAGLEDEYAKAKGKANTMTGTNNIGAIDERRPVDQLVFTITIKDKNGEIMYDNTAFAGVVSTVEQISDVDEHGMIDGKTQTFGFGHELSAWFAFDQLKQGFEAKAVSIMTRLVNIISTGQIKNPKVKAELIKAMNGQQ